MDDFSANECHGLAEVIREIILLMQMVDRRTILPVPSIPKGTFTVRKQSRRVTGPKAKTSKAMVCPAPQKAMPKRKVTQKAGNTTLGFIDATGNCVCPMPGRAGSSSRPTTRSMTKRKTRRLVKAKKPMKKSLRMTGNDRKQKVRRQNRKRPAMKKSMARKSVMECP